MAKKLVEQIQKWNEEKPESEWVVCEPNQITVAANVGGRWSGGYVAAATAEVVLRA